jgi:diguanylate cyclase
VKVRFGLRRLFCRIALPLFSTLALMVAEEFEIRLDRKIVAEHFKGNRGIEIARRAINELEKRALSATPENFAIWATHVAGANSELSQEIATVLIESGNEPEKLETASLGLYQKHFANQTFGEEVMEASDKMSKELEDALSVLKAAGQDTKAYGQALELSTAQLGKAGTNPENLRMVIQTLTSATQSMSKRSSELERRLEETTSEVNQLRNNLEKIQIEAQTDGLTGLANRRLFDKKMEQVCSDHWAWPLSLMLVDIDHFKSFNDTWGHQTGDQIIRFVAGVMRKFANANHLCARYGGEEFAIVMPATTERDAEYLAEVIRSYVETKKLRRRSTEEDLGKVTVSIGIGTCEEAESPESLIERTDKALYASKQSGRNRITFAAAPKSYCAA